jgi:predicted TIM-barrel fold metal-dependent hydrolase
MSAQQHFKRLISADSHVMEPLDLWWKALGQRFGERTPRYLSAYQGQPGNFFYTGYQGWPVTWLRDNRPETERAAVEAAARGLEACGYDPDIRVQFQQQAGIAAEVLNPTRLMNVMRNPDTEVVQACSQVYNDWVAEFVSHAPQRLIGVSVIPMEDVDWAVRELHRTARKGLRSAMINCQAPQGCPPYRDAIYDRFWAAASAADVSITLHILTGRKLDPIAFAYFQTEEEARDNAGLWVDLLNEIQLVLANDFIFGGILDHFPQLTVICSEFELSWVPGFMARLEQIEAVAPRLKLPRLQMPASDYMRQRIWHGFIDDTAAGFCIPYIGASRVLWGSDFPHIRSIGLDADSAVARLIASLPAHEQEMVVGGNAAEVFHLGR